MTENSIQINGVCFKFSEGRNIQFLTPSSQIYSPSRDSEGELASTVIQYVVELGASKEIEHAITNTIEASVEEMKNLESEELLQVEQELKRLELEAGQEVLRELGRKRLLEGTNGK